MSEHPSDELNHRIQALLDGTLEAEDIRRLDADLKASPEARELYRQLATLHSALEEQVASKIQMGRALVPMERLLADQRRTMVRNSLIAEDLGTKLGVLVRSGQRDQVHIIEGLVAVSATGAAKDERLELGEREAREALEGGGFGKIEFQPGKFTTALPNPITFVDADIHPATGNTVSNSTGAFGAPS